MKRARLALLSSLLSAACSPSAPSDFGVNLTLDFTALSRAEIARIERVRIRVRGDEQFDDESLTQSAIKDQQARLRYATALQTGQLDFIVDALDAQDVSLAHGRAPDVMLRASGATAVTIALGLTVSNGAPCGDALDCPNAAACLDGVCCAETSCPSCRTCGESGQCDVLVTDRIDADSCHGLNACDAEGTCSLHRSACASADECETGFCVDGVCCESACDGACQTCDAPDAPGLCRPVRSALDDHCTVDMTGAAMCDSNATCQPPHLVSNIHASAGSAPADFTLGPGGRIFFTADDGIHGRELWVTDGTAAGTQLFVDINAGAPSSAPTELTPYHGGILFVATKSNGSVNRGLWFTDGTPSGTTLVWTTGAFNENPDQLTVLNDKVYFAAFNSPGGVGRELHVYDGSSVTVAVDVNPGAAGSNISNMTIFNQRLFFGALVGSNGQEVYSSDGTPAGTALLLEIGPTTVDAVPANFYSWNDRFLFSARDASNNFEPYISDGTTAGTSKMLAAAVGTPQEINASSVNGSLTNYTASFTPLGTDLYFFAVTGSSIDRNFERYEPSDGLAHRVHTFATGDRDPRELIAFGGALYFSANAASGVNRSLWKSDGSNFGTDFFFGPATESATQNLSIFSASASAQFLFFSAVPAVGTAALHVFDGVSQSPVLACPQSAPCAAPSKLTMIEGRAYFSADPDGLGAELYVFP